MNLSRKQTHTNGGEAARSQARHWREELHGEACSRCIGRHVVASGGLTGTAVGGVIVAAHVDGCAPLCRRRRPAARARVIRACTTRRCTAITEPQALLHGLQEGLARHGRTGVARASPAPACGQRHTPAPDVSTPSFRGKNTQHIGKSQSTRTA
eukprot:COSAG01_NODE_30_length_36127_cov_41.433234_7_plen_154_part_00